MSKFDLIKKLRLTAAVLRRSLAVICESAKTRPTLVHESAKTSTRLVQLALSTLRRRFFTHAAINGTERSFPTDLGKV